MRDLPVTLRIAILAVLMISLLVILRQFLVEPGEYLAGERHSEAESMEEKPALTAASNPALYPPVPPVLPVANEGYLFNSERSFTETGADSSGGGSGGVDMDEVLYAGSLIVGEIHKGLIIYQEKSPVGARPARVSRGAAARTRGAAGKAVSKYKQLDLGENFMGYIVEKIEKDRVVFKRDDELVEKFLYDPNKGRTGGGNITQSQPAAPAPPAPRSVAPAVQPSLLQRPERPAAGTRGHREIAADPESPGGVPLSVIDEAAAVDLLINKRSERLLGLDPSLAGASSVDVPGDPLRR